MRTQCLIWTVIAAMTLTLTACQAPPGAGGATEPLAIITHHHGNDAGLPIHDVFLVNSQSELETIGSTELVNAGIDFENKSLVILSLGSKPTGGYWACISGLQQQGNELFVQGVANRPGADQVVTQAVTYPYCAVEVWKTDADVMHPEIDPTTGQAMPQ